jgi:xylan 1,4-beta-xylosidase
MHRRSALGLLLGSASAPQALVVAGEAGRAGDAALLDPFHRLRWARGFDGQRRADLGDGHFLNPVFAGDHPDPALLRDGEDYYLTFSSFDANPGVLIWHSRDLVNWRLVTAALRSRIGSVWAPDLGRHGGRYFCYLPARTAQRRSIYQIEATRIDGPWSEPVDLDLPEHIDPAHVVDESGQRWLYLSGGDRVALAADGRSTIGAPEHVHDPWRYPDDWVVESFSPEGPKLFRRDPYWYLVTAVGGTAGPPTGHMVIVSRSRTLHGPWQHHPHNPVVRTRSAREKWWSRGHATLFEGPRGRWWMLLHGYEHGYWTLGRQTLLAPVEWGADGWPIVHGGDLSRPLRKPLDLPRQSHGMPLGDDFTAPTLGLQWAFHDSGADAGAPARVLVGGGSLRLQAQGGDPGDCSVLTCIAGDQAYVIEVDVDADTGAEGGLLLFYNRRLYAGLGVRAGSFVMHRYGLQRLRRDAPAPGRALRIRLQNDRHIVTIHTSEDAGLHWRKFDVQMEVSGYHHNVAYDFLSLRPALYAAGRGAVRFARFTYAALP